MHLQVAMALYTDPPHQKHVPSILSGTELPENILIAADKPRQQTLWCEMHDQRMRDRRNGGSSYADRNGGGGYGASVVRLLLCSVTSH